MQVAESLFGRETLTAEFAQGVQAGRRRFGFEGPRGVGKSAFLDFAKATLKGQGYSVAELNAAEHATEDLAIAAIYSELKELAQDPEAVILNLRDRLLLNTPKAVRKVAAAVAADLLKLVAEKAENTIDAIKDIAGGEAFDNDAAAQLETLGEANRRLFLSRFLESLVAAGNKVAIAIDNLNGPNHTTFVRYLMDSQPGITILAAHNTEGGDNADWELIQADMKAAAGIVWPIEPLSRAAVTVWARAILGETPSDAWIDELMATTHGRAYDVRVVLDADRDGIERPPARDYRGYYAIMRQQLDADGETVAELLAVLPPDKSVPVESLAVAAKAFDIVNIIPPLDQLRGFRLLKESGSSIAMAHSIAQEFWCDGITSDRYRALAGAWRQAFASNDPAELTSGDAVAMLPLIADELMATKSDTEIAAIGEHLVNVGETETGLLFLDRTWRSGPQGGGEATLQYALRSAQIRLQLGRYNDVEEPLRQAEAAARGHEDRIGVLLVRMKLALRRNSYTVMWNTFHQLEPLVRDYPSAQAEAQSILNVAYRDLLDLEGVRETAARLIDLRAALDEHGRLSVDRDLARALAKLGDVDGALPYAESALHAAVEVDSIRDIGNAHLARGEVHRYGRRYNEAIADYQMAAEIARGIGNRDSELWSLLAEAAAHLEAGDAIGARPIFDTLRHLLDQPGYEHPLETAHFALLQALAGTPIESIEDTVARYGRLGIGWPEQIIRASRDSGGIERPTPL